MPNIQEKETGIFSKITSLLKQYPLVAFCLWMGYRDIKRDAYNDKKEKEQISRDIDRETFYRSQLIYMRNQIEEQNKEKEQEITELNTQNGKDTL